MRLTLALLLLFVAVHPSQAAELRHFDPCVEAGIKKSVVFLGEMLGDKKAVFHATGFLVSVDSVFYIVTAKHVVWDSDTKLLRNNEVFAFFNQKSGKATARSLELTKAKFGVNWVFHPNENIDVAMLPFPLDQANDDVRVIPSEIFEPASRLSELQDLFFLSYHPGLELPDQIAPIARRGMVSFFKDDGTFYMDAFIFPGNSGSPVFVKSSPMTFMRGGAVTPGDPQGCKFVGLAGEYLPYVDVAFSAQTKRPRVTFEENSGLARVWPVEIIAEVTNSPAFKAQHAKIRGVSGRGDR